jgi:hypothetical protein
MVQLRPSFPPTTKQPPTRNPRANPPTIYRIGFSLPTKERGGERIIPWGYSVGGGGTVICQQAFPVQFTTYNYHLLQMINFHQHY